ncbi:MAG: hypothetical protein IJR99_12100 [Kiritimatiellae bacterium]|nr:hypothetical protein [Kiritimatiellia bacterium]
MVRQVCLMVFGMCGTVMAVDTSRQTVDGGAVPEMRQISADSERAASRKKMCDRMQADLELYGKDGLRAIEQAYRAYSQSKDVDNEQLQTLITKYPKANRTGCAVMYAGQRARGSDDGKWFRLAIEKYGDCLYGNGVQVGAYARFYLARYLYRAGRKAEADALRDEILKHYPDARTHRGQKLADYLQ